MMAFVCAMPLYEYQCDACGARFELIRKFSDPPLTVCPTCGVEPVRKLFSSPAFQFKGSGFYATDYGRKTGEKDRGTVPAGESGGESKGDTKTDTKKDAARSGTDTKPAEKPAASSGEKTSAKDKDKDK